MYFVVTHLQKSTQGNNTPLADDTLIVNNFILYSRLSLGHCSSSCDGLEAFGHHLKSFGQLLHGIKLCHLI